MNNNINLVRKKGVIVLALLATSSLLPAAISWQTSVGLFDGGNNEDFVSLDGVGLVAYNASSVTNPVSALVNGVTFTGSSSGNTLTGASGESITLNNGGNNQGAFGDGAFSGNAEINNLLAGGAFNLNSVTLGGLTIGQDYQIQVFNHDGRGSRDVGDIVGFGDGTGSTTPVAFSGLSDNAASGPGGTGDFIIGTFTATSASLEFNIFGTPDGGAFTTGNSPSQINAIQLRAIPEPSSVALLGIGGLAFILRRRK